MKIRMIRSKIGSTPKQRKVLDALGLRKMHKVKELPENGSVKGMIKLVEHLVEVVE